MQDLNFVLSTYMRNNGIYHHGEWYVKEHGQCQLPAIDKGYNYAYGHVAHNSQKMAQILGNASANFFHVT